MAKNVQFKDILSKLFTEILSWMAANPQSRICVLWGSWERVHNTHESEYWALCATKLLVAMLMCSFVKNLPSSWPRYSSSSQPSRKSETMSSGVHGNNKRILMSEKVVTDTRKKVINRDGVWHGGKIQVKGNTNPRSLWRASHSVQRIFKSRYVSCGVYKNNERHAVKHDLIRCCSVCDCRLTCLRKIPGWGGMEENDAWNPHDKDFKEDRCISRAHVASQRNCKAVDCPPGYTGTRRDIHRSIFSLGAFRFVVANWRVWENFLDEEI